MKRGKVANTSMMMEIQVMMIGVARDVDDAHGDDGDHDDGDDGKDDHGQPHGNAGVALFNTVDSF